MTNGNFVEGVNIISKYLKKDSYGLDAGHDQIYFGDYDIVTDEKDKEKLLELV